MSESEKPSLLTRPILLHAQKLNVLDHAINMMLEGRRGEALCILGGLSYENLASSTAEDDQAILAELEAYIWEVMKAVEPSLRGYLEEMALHPLLIHTTQLLREEAPPERILAVLTGFALSLEAPSPKLYAMMVMNELTRNVNLEKAATSSALPN